ncbi:MAG: hypothetical protein HUJ26_15015 [Planctomycetaceae bacterium]|nr:hypothetical protein [Planctomycetaceae bacterium]
MTSWPGGPCPSCGEDVPANVIRCRECGKLLNDDLQEPTPVEIPEYQALPEVTVCPSAFTTGVYVLCPVCDRELRINNKYRNQNVRCKFCEASFVLDLSQPMIELQSFLTNCPHCEKELRAAPKYLNQKVECKFCHEPLLFNDSIKQN